MYARLYDLTHAFLAALRENKKKSDTEKFTARKNWELFNCYLKFTQTYPK